MPVSNPSSRMFSSLRQVLLVALLIITGTATLTGCEPAQPTKQSVVILTPLPFDILDESIHGIREGLTAEGYGQDRVNVRVVNANGQMQMLAGYAREIVAGQPNVIVPVSTPATQAVVAAAPASQNIVFSTVTNPEAANVPPNAANITGVSDVVNYQANVALLMELFPQARRVGTIYNPGDDAATYGLRQLQALAARHGLQLRAMPATNSNEAVIAARGLANDVDAILIGSDSNAAAAMAGIAREASQRRIPVLASDAGSVRNGALAAISVDYRQLGRAGARLIVQVLRSGAPAGQVPRVTFVGNQLIINESTARSIGYAFSPELMARRPLAVGQSR